MKKSLAPLFIGIALIVVGLGYIANVFFGWDLTFAFEGWWTLFLIVPALIHMIARGIQWFNSIVFVGGSLWLLYELDIIPQKEINNVLIAAGILMIGMAFLIHFIRPSKPKAYEYAKTSTDYANYDYKKKPSYQTDYTNTDSANSKTDYTGDFTTPPPNQNANYNNDFTASSNDKKDYNDYSDYKKEDYKKDYNEAFVNVDNDDRPTYNALLSGINEKNNSTDFLGAKISAVMGGVDLDLREAVVKQDITITVSAVMGGVTIYAPKNVRIKLKRSDIMGASSCVAKSMPQDTTVPFVTFDCSAFMGSIEIK